MSILLLQNNGDRAYLVKIGGQFEEIKMAAMLVNGLSRLNGIEYRKKLDLDGAFIKALIIGLCTAKAIVEGERIHKDMLIFIKGLQSAEKCLYLHCVFMGFSFYFLPIQNFSLFAYRTKMMRMEVATSLSRNWFPTPAKKSVKRSKNQAVNNRH